VREHSEGVSHLAEAVGAPDDVGRARGVVRLMMWRYITDGEEKQCWIK
jgi:hypothetical protein